MILPGASGNSLPIFQLVLDKFFEEKKTQKRFK
jgi:hypothetical protein